MSGGEWNKQSIWKPFYIQKSSIVKKMCKKELKYTCTVDIINTHGKLAKYLPLAH